MDTYRLIFLGAGFSKPAGFPLADELFRELRKSIRSEFGSDNIFESDLNYFVHFKKETEGFSGNADDINLEEFLSFLDIEHILQLKGSDTWSEEGNKSQLISRFFIGKILFKYLSSKIPDIYKRFVEGLNPTDIVLTFYYDTLLEHTFEQIGKPYRLFPQRYKNVYRNHAEVDIQADENDIAILKLHGSIDWFDKSQYIRHLDNSKQSEFSYPVDHFLFDENTRLSPSPIIDGPRFEDDPLQRIYKVKDISYIYSNSKLWWQCSPFLLNPSHNKLLYIKPLTEFWNGLGRSGGWNLGLGIIGYSLPEYDDYARQALYRVIKNYQGFDPDYELLGQKRRNLRILDYKQSNFDKLALQKKYSFANSEYTEFWFNGLTNESVDWFLK